MEAPALAKLHKQYRSEGFRVVAINIQPEYPLPEWERFWKSSGAGEVIWAQDVEGATIEAYRLVALGTVIVVDRQGQIVFRSDGSPGARQLQRKIEEAL
ncbi:MAG: TlpA family protein disulfide reductase [Chloroflexi bacterium]|nr:TlpA family protein disulfide reductase [Chloroflexota bacterium]